MNIKVALLSLEMMLPKLPEPLCGANFKGGLGILAGDIAINLRNVGIEGAAFTPLYSYAWSDPTKRLCYEQSTAHFTNIKVNLAGNEFAVSVRLVNHENQIFGFLCPEIFDVLYTENRRKRLLQESLFARAVSQALKLINFVPDTVWLNESHTALTLPFLKEDAGFAKTKILFTIHTPEQAGMEKFYEYRFDELGLSADRYKSIFIKDGVLDLTWAAMVMADAINAVSEEHGETTGNLFPNFTSKIVSVTNGTDLNFWTHQELKEAIEKKVGAKNLLDIHQRARRYALEVIRRKSGISLDPAKPTAWFVRRFAPYKNLDVMISAILPAICAECGQSVETPVGKLEGLGMQVVGAGKALESDGICMSWIAKFNDFSGNEFRGRFVFLPEYNLELLQAGARGSDIWLVTPEKKREACGTSDQRAEINGIPVLTTKTGGMLEYVQEFDPKTGKGNGFFIEPYEPRTIYEKLKIFSRMWYEWHQKKKGGYPKLKMNALKTRARLDIQTSLRKYKKLFLKMLKQSS